MADVWGFPNKKERFERKAEPLFSPCVRTPAVLAILSNLNIRAEKVNIQNSKYAAEIPEYVFESLARSLLPIIQKYYESEDGKKAFAEWKAKKEISDSAST